MPIKPKILGTSPNRPSYEKEGPRCQYCKELLPYTYYIFDGSYGPKKNGLHSSDECMRNMLKKITEQSTEIMKLIERIICQLKHGIAEK